MHSAQQKGHILLILLVAVAAALAGMYFVSGMKPASKQVLPVSTPASNKPIFEDKELKFEFEYPKDFEVIKETEEEYSERTKTTYRKNFAYYVEYKPPKFIKGIVVKPKKMELTSDQFEQVPLTLWVFENTDKWDVEKWYANFWYYPFVWGIFDEPRKGQISPSEGGIVSYSPGKPKFILLPKDDKMFLFKVMEGGDKILNSFKFK